ncbi:MAG: CAP domain-containing protein [Solirubrobacterales bacterium]
MNPRGGFALALASASIAFAGCGTDGPGRDAGSPPGSNADSGSASGGGGDGPSLERTVTIGEGVSAGPRGSRNGGSQRQASPGPAGELPGGCAGESASFESANRAQLEQAAFCLINAVRAKRGLPRLSASPALKRAARTHSNDMDRDNYFAHVAPGGTDLLGWVRGTGYLEGSRGYRLAENIGFGEGSAGSPAGIVAGWLESPSHRKNILNPELKDAGMGAAIGTIEESGAKGVIYTNIFGSQRNVRGG